MTSPQRKNVVVVLPCYNEELTITETIRQMQGALPEARLVVFDNNSKDKSAALARAEGVEVRSVRYQGKGNVVRRMFADLDADVYLMVDADTTYDPATAPLLIDAILNDGADMAVGIRKGKDSSFPPGHKFGNWLFNQIVSNLFGRGMEDILSGYRAFSRRFARSFPSHSAGFEIETEISIFTLEQRLPFIEIPSPYGERPAGSFSKLHTFRDGFRILWTILSMLKNLHPLFFFGMMSLFLALVSLALGIPVVLDWVRTGLVTREPTAILSSAFGILSVILLITGLVLNGLARAARETRHLAYLGWGPHDSASH